MAIEGYRHDTMIMHHIVHNDRGIPHDLGFINSLYGTIPYYKHVAKGDKDSPKDENNFALLDVDDMRQYNLDDCQATAQARDGMLPEIRELQSEHIYQHDMRKNHIVRKIMQRGLLMDQALRYKFKVEAEQDIRNIEEDLRDIIGPNFNPNSDAHLRHFLIDELGFQPRTYTQKLRQAKVDFEALIGFQELLHNTDPIRSVFDLLVSRNKYETIVSNFLGGRSDKTSVRPRRGDIIISPSGSVHTRFSLHIVPSGRLASASPNLQNVPDSIRSMFIARPGHVFISRDYSQIEFRIYAYGADDDVLIAVFESQSPNKLDRDPHTQSAVDLFRVHADEVRKDQRDFIKIFHYGGLLYAGTAATIRAQAIKEVLKQRYETKNYNLQVVTPTANEIDFLMQRWFTKHPRAALFNARVESRVERDSTAETLLLGRKRFFTSPLHEAKRSARSHVVSGTAADIIDLAMFQLHDRLTTESCGGLVLQIHDELLFEVPEWEKDKWIDVSRELMEQPHEINGRKIVFPTECKVGRSWGELEKV